MTLTSPQGTPEEARRVLYEEAKATLRLEGLILSSEEDAIGERFVAGELTLDQMGDMLMELP